MLTIKANELWNSFKEELIFKNRFIAKHKILDYIECFAQKNNMVIEKSKILYRARLYTGDESFTYYLGKDVNYEGTDMTRKLMILNNKFNIKNKEETGFWGYDEENSFVPKNSDLINDGRANPAFIKYLYTAEDPYTAMVEVRPYLKSKVSIAEIKVKESLNIVDFSFESFGNFEGFDGIRFNSSLHGSGRNITIFNFEKCQPVGSRLYEISDICFDAKGIAPNNTNNLNHYKLEPYKNNEKKLLLQRLAVKMDKQK